MATNVLKFFKAGIANWVAFVVGVLGVDCAASVGKMYTWSVEGATGSGLLVGNGFKTSPWGSSTALLSYKGKNFFFLLPWKNNSTHI